MDISLSMFILLMSATLVLGQRPFFAGTKPIGYPETPNITDSLGDRFGEVDGTTPRLPVEAHGDLAFIDRLSKLPVDKQPFWFINWQAYEAHRQNPQTYPQRPSSFNDPIPTTNNANSGAVNSNSVPISNSDTNANRFGEPDSNVKPVVASTNNDKNVESKPDSEPKPVATVNNDKKEESSKEKPAVPNSDSTNSNNDSSTSKSDSTTSKSDSTTSKSDSSNSKSEPEKKVVEVAPLLPSPIEPEPAPIDGLKLKEDTSAEKKFRYFRRP
ncbi:peroxisomal membrane protein PEX14 isoform X2 [Manduca sexta]|uniref:peroxisomal membrane protein PEX14 isoform X2 n=1 Tax=Manduca sexta TaxID=7130 RepID=UPI00188EC0AF|nr:peroxisomal membrane protein PEX14 isoform X2 [Manduca sexta]